MPMSAERRVAVAERRTQAVKLAASGLSYEVIAQRLGYTHRSAARKAVVRALQARTAEAVDQLRVLESERLDRLLQAVWGQAMHGDLASVDRAVKVVSARMKLFGLDQHDNKPVGGGGRIVSSSWQPGPIAD